MADESDGTACKPHGPTAPSAVALTGWHAVRCPRRRGAPRACPVPSSQVHADAGPQRRRVAGGAPLVGSVVAEGRKPRPAPLDGGCAPLSEAQAAASMSLVRPTSASIVARVATSDPGDKAPFIWPPGGAALWRGLCTGPKGRVLWGRDRGSVPAMPVRWSFLGGSLRRRRVRADQRARGRRSRRRSLYDRQADSARREGTSL